MDLEGFWSIYLFYLAYVQQGGGADGLEEILLVLMLDYSSMLCSFTSCTLFGGLYLWHAALLTSIDSWGYVCTLLHLFYKGGRGSVKKGSILLFTSDFASVFSLHTCLFPIGVSVRIHSS
jgi:hypothetical protein